MRTFVALSVQADAARAYCDAARDFLRASGADVK